MQKSASIQPRTSLSKFGGDFVCLFIRLLRWRSSDRPPTAEALLEQSGHVSLPRPPWMDAAAGLLAAEARLPGEVSELEHLFEPPADPQVVVAAARRAELPTGSLQGD